MVASKRIHCAICDKKCSGKVLRYQDQYYHKQCFESEQSEDKRQQQQQEQYLSTTNDTSSGRSGVNPVRSDAGADSLDAASESQQFHSNTLSNQQRSESSATLISNQRRHQQQHNGDLSSSSPGLPRPPVASRHNQNGTTMQTYQQRGQTLDSRPASLATAASTNHQHRSATLPHSNSTPANGFNESSSHTQSQPVTSSTSRHFNTCAGCKSQIKDGQALIALDLHWHVWCFKCAHCKVALHGEYVAKDGRAYCERDYQKLFGVTCVYCKRYITGKVLQAGEAHHFHPSCARCSKCGDPFVPGEEMYLQGEVTWHPRCGPGPDGSAAGLDESTILGGGELSSRSQQVSSLFSLDHLSLSRLCLHSQKQPHVIVA